MHGPHAHISRLPSCRLLRAKDEDDQASPEADINVAAKVTPRKRKRKRPRERQKHKQHQENTPEDQ